MKTRDLFIIFVAAVLMLIISGCGQNKNQANKVTGEATENAVTETSDSDAKGKPLGIRSGIIEYTYSGDRTGKSIQYFDDYGMKNAVYTEIVSQGDESKGWVVTIGEDQYMWDLSNQGQGMKTKNPMLKSLVESSGKDILSYMASMYEQMGMTKSGKETFLGKDCDVFRGPLGEVLVWKGIMIKMEMNMGTIVSRQEATSIKTNVSVDGKYFRIPDNITFSEIPGY